MPGIPKPKKHWKKQNNIWRLLARPSHSPKPLEHCVFLFLVFSRKSKKTKKTHNIWRLLAGPSHPAKTSGKMCVFLFSRGKKQQKNIWRLLAGPSHPAKTSGKMLFLLFSRVFFCFPNVWSSKPARCLARFGWWPPLSAAGGFQRYALYILCIYRPSGFLT